MTQVSAGFETGVNGNTIATADAGNATAWNAVTLGTGGTAVYDSTQKHGGTLSGKLTRGTAGQCFVQWIAALGTVTDHYGRAYVYLAANPGAAFALVLCMSGASNACQIRLDTAGVIRVRDSTGAETSGAVSLALNQWVRIEWHFLHSTTVGVVEAKVFNTPDSLTPDDTITAINQNTLASADRIRFQVDVNASYTVQYDDIIAGAGSYPGPSLGTLSPSTLVHTRALGSPIVSVKLFPASLVHARALGTLTIGPAGAVVTPTVQFSYGAFKHTHAQTMFNRHPIIHR